MQNQKLKQENQFLQAQHDIMVKRFIKYKHKFEKIKSKYFVKSGRLDNHEVPQYKFVTDKNSKLIPHIKIFKCEKLNECNIELNKYIGFDINIKQENVNKDYSKYLNKDSISLINFYYKKDFEMFGYKLK